MARSPNEDAAIDYSDNSERERRRSYAQQPKPIGKVLARLITSRGYGRVESSVQLQATWLAAVGERLGQSSRAYRVYRGKLEILVANSAIRQEFEFQRQQILAEMRSRMPEAKIKDLRFRVGTW